MRALIAGMAIAALTSIAFAQEPPKEPEWISTHWEKPTGDGLANNVANFINRCEPKDTSGIAGFISQINLNEFNVIVFCRMDKSGKRWQGGLRGWAGEEFVRRELVRGAAIIGDGVNLQQVDKIIIVGP